MPKKKGMRPLGKSLPLRHRDTLGEVIDTPYCPVRLLHDWPPAGHEATSHKSRHNRSPRGDDRSLTENGERP